MATQIYKTSSIEEYVIIGNDALMKCIIPSFVTDWVSVVSWEGSEGDVHHRSGPPLGNGDTGQAHSSRQIIKEVQPSQDWLYFLHYQ